MEKIKKRYIAGIVVIVIIAAVIIYFKQQSGIIPARRTTVENRIVKSTVGASATVKSRNFAGLSFPLTGKITYLPVTEGQIVAPNQILARIDTFTTAQTAQAAKDALEIAEKDKRLYQEQYESPEFIDFKQSDEYFVQLQRYDDLINRARANYLAATGGFRNLEIKAPFAATILDVTKKQGETATAGVSLITLADLNDLYLSAFIDQEDLANVKIGQPVEIQMDAYENQTFYGEVTRLPLYISTADANQLEVEVSLDQELADKVLVGMEGDVYVVVRQTETEVSALPFDAIFEDETGSFIWIVQDGKLAKRYITIGVEGDLYIEVSNDIAAETIITPQTQNNQEVKEGLKVKIQ